MSKTKHSPDAWVAHVHPNGKLFPSVCIGGCRTGVHETYGDNHPGNMTVINKCLGPSLMETHNANARLIAAAPELLAALLELGGWVMSFRQDGNTPEFMEGLTEVLARGDAAVGKATGESEATQ